MSPASTVMTGFGMMVGIGATEEVGVTDLSMSGCTIMLTMSREVMQRPSSRGVQCQVGRVDAVEGRESG